MNRKLISRVIVPCAVLVLSAVACSGQAKTAAVAPSLPTSTTPVKDITFVAFDTETTGFGPKQNTILEIGAVKFRNGKVLDEKSWLIDPKMKISWWAEKAHHISADMVKGQPTFDQAYPEFREFCKGCVLIAHNATFDVEFMKADVERAGGAKLTNPCLDSLNVFRALFPDEESHSLEPLSTKLGVDGEVYHRATDDARYIFLILNVALDRKSPSYTYGQLTADAGGEKWFK